MVVTVVSELVLGLVFMYLVIRWLFSGWGDHFPPTRSVTWRKRRAPS